MTSERKPLPLIYFLGKISVLDGWFPPDEEAATFVRWTETFPEFGAFVVWVDVNGARMLDAILPKVSPKEFIAGEMTMELQRLLDNKRRDDNAESEIEI